MQQKNTDGVLCIVAPACQKSLNKMFITFLIEILPGCGSGKHCGAGYSWF